MGGSVSHMCSSGMAVPVTDMNWSGDLVVGQECFCAEDSACDTIYEGLDKYTGMGTMKDGVCLVSTSFYGAVEYTPGCDGPHDYGDADNGFPHECVCVPECTAGDASVFNMAGDCICPAGQSDVNGDGATCAAIDFAVCAARTICQVGQLQVDIEMPPLCFDVDGMDVSLNGEDCDVLHGDLQGDFVPSATLLCGPASSTSLYEWFPVGSACQVAHESDVAGGRKRQMASPLVPMPGFVMAAASAQGDPHLTGPNGRKFDFFGQNNGIYAFFAAPHFAVNVQLGKVHDNHFIKQVEVMVRGVSQRFTLAAQRGPQHYLTELNRKFGKVGIVASYPDAKLDQLVIELELCKGERIVLEKKVTVHGGEHYFDVEIIVPGCHDDFDGALGQTYKCKYVEQQEEFAFDSSMEENFRVKTLGSPFGVYKAEKAAKCPEKHNSKSISGRSH